MPYKRKTVNKKTQELVIDMAAKKSVKAEEIRLVVQDTTSSLSLKRKLAESETTLSHRPVKRASGLIKVHSLYITRSMVKGA